MCIIEDPIRYLQLSTISGERRKKLRATYICYMSLFFSLGRIMKMEIDDGQFYQNGKKILFITKKNTHY